MSAGDVLRAIRELGPVTRADLTACTGLARSTIAQRVDALLAHDLVREVGAQPSTGGRRATALAFNAAAGVVLAADLGATHARIAVADLAGGRLADRAAELPIAAGPERVLAAVERDFASLLRACGRDRADVRAIGIGVPGPVEFASGRPVSPPIMPGWDGVEIPRLLRARWPVPILVDNDVNIMALGEHANGWPQLESLLFVKVATGVGAGIVTHGRIYRGASGAAGDIGRIRVPGHDDVRCECGNSGCLEAVAGGRAIARDLRGRGLDVEGSRDIVALVRRHDVDAVAAVRQAGRQLGDVLAGVVNALNPQVIVVGGDLADAHEQLFAGMREVVYRRSTALATRHLEIVHGVLGDRAGVAGAAAMAIERALSRGVLDATLAQPAPRATAALLGVTARA
jgi:predicted NBD/HSP70 family sugar kinase